MPTGIQCIGELRRAGYPGEGCDPIRKVRFNDICWFATKEERRCGHKGDVVALTGNSDRGAARRYAVEPSVNREIGGPQREIGTIRRGDVIARAVEQPRRRAGFERRRVDLRVAVRCPRVGGAASVRVRERGRCIRAYAPCSPFLLMAIKPICKSSNDLFLFFAIVIIRCTAFLQASSGEYP